MTIWHTHPTQRDMEYINSDKIFNSEAYQKNPNMNLEEFEKLKQKILGVPSSKKRGGGGT